MAEATYVIEPWSGLNLYTCLAPESGGFLHGWQCFTLERITTHLLEAHGLDAVEQTSEE